MKGRKPKSRKLKLIEGNPGKKPIKKRSISETDERVTMPRGLSPEAKKFWKELAPKLKKRGLLTPLDQAAFTALCVSYTRMMETSEILRKEGETITDNRGVQRRNPVATIYSQASAQFKSWCEMFGLSPLARERISIPEAPQMSFREQLATSYREPEGELDNEEF